MKYRMTFLFLGMAAIGLVVNNVMRNHLQKTQPKAVEVETVGDKSTTVTAEAEISFPNRKK